jgi:hypothetical protein
MMIREMAQEANGRAGSGRGPGTWQSARLQFYAILGALLCLNLWQAYATGLCHDEAYYWVYSRFLDWGYFDHPPMVAAIIALGSSVIESELGVRLVFVVMQISVFALMWRMTNRRDALLFWALTLSFPLLHVGGMLALPDMPLVFFATLFLLAARRYIAKDDWVSVLCLSGAAAMMLYSKYHGVLVILLTIAAVPSLLRRKTLWLGALLTGAALLPHLLWQTDNDFISVRFQLSRRPDWFNPSLVFEYIGGQIGCAGIFSGAILFYLLLFKSRSAGAFERVLKLNCIGIFAFFLVMAFKGRVEANWTVVAFVPLAVLGHTWLQRMRRLRRWTLWLTLVPVIAVLAGRALFIFPPEGGLPVPRVYECTDWPRVTQKIEDHAGGLPIVACVYQHASSVSFYSRRIVPALNLRSRQNQFSLWQFENALLDEEVCLVANFEIPDAKHVDLRQGGRLYLLKGLTVREIRERF